MLTSYVSSINLYLGRKRPPKGAYRSYLIAPYQGAGDPLLSMAALLCWVLHLPFQRRYPDALSFLLLDLLFYFSPRLSLSITFFAIF